MLKDLGLLVLRVSTGVTMAAHGFPKLFGGPEKEPPKPLARAMGKNYAPAFRQGGPGNFSQALESMSVSSPKLAAYASGIAEFGGGLGLLLGFKTRLAALLVLANLSVAIGKVHWQNGFFGEGGFEFPASLWSGALTLLLTGPGAISLDGSSSGRKEPRSHLTDEE